MSVDETLQTPDPFDLLLDLVDAETGCARVRVELAYTAGDCIEIDDAIAHQEGVDEAVTYLLGGGPTPNWEAFTEAVIPTCSPSVGWHLFISHRTRSYLKSIRPERGDAAPNLDGLVYRITLDQMLLARRLLHLDEVAERFNIDPKLVNDLINTDAITYCFVSGIPWVIETADLEASLHPEGGEHTP